MINQLGNTYTYSRVATPVVLFEATTWQFTAVAGFVTADL